MAVPLRWIGLPNALVVAALLTGCSVLGGRDQPVSHFVLEDRSQHPAGALPALTGTLLLRETEAAGLCQGAALVFSREPGRLGLYQYARWTEPLPRRLHQLLKTRLDPHARVASLGSGVVGDWQLNTRLLECHHDARQSPGQARLSLEVELVDRSRGELRARRTFEATEPLAGYDAGQAAAALSRATSQVLDQVETWLSRQAAAAPAGAAR